MASQYSEMHGARSASIASVRAITRRIGLTLREVYDNPEADALPNDHVDLLLRLRHKEREQNRARR